MLGAKNIRCCRLLTGVVNKKGSDIRFAAKTLIPTQYYHAFVKTSSILAHLALSCAVVAPWCQGSVLITITESGSDVVVSGSGTLNTSGLSSGSGGGNAAVRPTSPLYFATGSGAFGPLQVFSSIFGPSAIGSSSSLRGPTSGTGSLFGIANTSLLAPSGYVSGSPLSGTSTYAGQTFATLGLTPGNYTWTWGSGGNADSLTIAIGTVPEPSETLAVAGVVCLGVAALRRWKRQA
jgi:hypothetical protein